MPNSLEKQLLDIAHNPLFFSKEINYLKKLFSEDEQLIGFIDGYMDAINLEGTAYLTNHRLLVIGFNHGKFQYDQVNWQSLIQVKSDINDVLSSFTFITPFKSLRISNIESKYLAREFYNCIRLHINKSSVGEPLIHSNSKDALLTGINKNSKLS